MFREPAAAPVQRQAGQEFGLVGEQNGFSPGWNRSMRGPSGTVGEIVEHRNDRLPPTLDGCKVRVRAQP
jgi:hypothetical protein